MEQTLNLILSTPNGEQIVQNLISSGEIKKTKNEIVYLVIKE